MMSRRSAWAWLLGAAAGLGERWALAQSAAASARAKAPALASSARAPVEPTESWVLELVPERLRELQFWGLPAWQWVGLLVSLLGGWIVASLVARAVVGALDRLARHTVASWDDLMLAAARRPVRLLLAVLLFGLGASQLGLPPGTVETVHHAVYTGLVVGGTWFLLNALTTGTSVYEGALADDTVGELRSRAVRTRLSVARSVGSVLLLLTSASILLMQFEIIRNVGLSLLASAGVAGVVLGFAAQKSLGGVIAGIQLSISQPVRIGDLVQFDGEFGTIEEINLTFIVIKLWDERRLVVPIQKFLEVPVQNWSREGQQLLGTAVVHADPAVPVPLVRAELERLCKAHAMWDGRYCKLQVTDTTAETVVLRALVSVGKVDDLFDLRCDVREGLVRFLAQLEGGMYLPRRRWAEVPAPVATAAVEAKAEPPRAEAADAKGEAAEAKRVEGPESGESKAPGLRRSGAEQAREGLNCPEGVPEAAGVW